MGKPRCITAAHSSRPSATPIARLLPLINEAPNCCRTRKPMASLKAAAQGRSKADQYGSRARGRAMPCGLPAESEGCVKMRCMASSPSFDDLHRAIDMLVELLVGYPCSL